VWDEVAAEPDLCQRMKCPHFDRCFLFKARREAAQADVIVVNHHLLLSDVAVRRTQQNWDDAAVLPPTSGWCRRGASSSRTRRPRTWGPRSRGARCSARSRGSTAAGRGCSAPSWARLPRRTDLL
jgi:hypothetical protein